MAREIEKLTANRVKALANVPGLHGDGNGLYLRCKARRGIKGELRLSASWVIRFMLNRQAHEMGLGPYPTIGLGKARQKAHEALSIVKGDRRDPIEEKRAARAAKRLGEAKLITFKAAAEKYIAAHKAGWRNAKHAKQWKATLATYAEPIIGALPVQSVDTGLVLKVLEPIWTAKAETASRLRGRIEAILNWATVRGYRTGENPARWKGHLESLLADRAKVKRVEHHAALPYADIGEFMSSLRRRQATAARALEFAILTAARTGEVIGARRNEIDLNIGLWIVPADRMKAARDHRVPLSPPAIAIVTEMDEAAGESAPADRFLFPGPKTEKPLSNMSMLTLLRRMKRDDLTTHGFRSSFRDWCAERTNYPSEVAEMALAHTVGDKVEAAYRRGDLFERRRRLMADWATYCATPSANGEVIALRRPNA